MDQPKSGIMSYLINEQDREHFFHSSGYAKGNYGQNMGSAGGQAETFESRRSMDERRKFVKKYNNARVISDVRAFDRVRGTVLTGVKSENTRSRLANSTQTQRDSGGRTMSGNLSGMRGQIGRQSGSGIASRPATLPAYRNPGIHR